MDFQVEGAFQAVYTQIMYLVYSENNRYSDSEDNAVGLWVRLWVINSTIAKLYWL